MSIPTNLSDRATLAACVAELLADARGKLTTPMPTKYSYPATNDPLVNEGQALINLTQEMLAYFNGQSGGGGTPQPTTITVLPTLPSLTGPGQTLQFTAIVKDQNGNVLTPGVGGVPALFWSSTNPTSATVNSTTGLATEVGNGSTIIIATCGQFGGGTTLTTSGSGVLVPTTVTVSPSSASLTSQGATQQFTAVVKDQNGTVMTPGQGGVPALVWTLVPGAAATINASSGLVTETGNGSETVKCTCGSAFGTASLTCSGVQPPPGQPTTVTVSPVGASLTAVGQTQQYSAVVKDQNLNILTPGQGGTPALVWSSSNSGSATINSSTGLATETGNGITQITAQCTPASGSTNLNTSGAVQGNNGNLGQNEPGGLTTVISTGLITTTPARQLPGCSGNPCFNWTLPMFPGSGVPSQTATNFSPASPSSTGDWAQNLDLVSNYQTGQSGYRIFYPTNLQGGNSPVRWGISWSGTHGTGTLYHSFRFRLSPNWTLSLASGLKVIRIFQSNGPNNNHFIGFGADGLATDGSNMWAGGLLQFNSSQYFANVPGSPNGQAQSPTASGINAAGNIGGVGRGSWHIFEQLRIPESPAGANNGQWTFWVDGVLVWTSVGKALGTGGVPTNGVRFNETGQTPGYSGFIFDPTYGGDVASDHPPSSAQPMYFDVDSLYISVG